MCRIMCQCFGVNISYGFWLGLTIHAYEWDVTTARDRDVGEQVGSAGKNSI
jgi:hypothetical protein